MDCLSLDLGLATRLLLSDGCVGPGGRRRGILVQSRFCWPWAGPRSGSTRIQNLSSRALAPSPPLPLMPSRARSACPAAHASLVLNACETIELRLGPLVLFLVAILWSSCPALFVSDGKNINCTRTSTCGLGSAPFAFVQSFPRRASALQASPDPNPPPLWTQSNQSSQSNQSTLTTLLIEQQDIIITLSETTAPTILMHKRHYSSCHETPASLVHVFFIITLMSLALPPQP